MIPLELDDKFFCYNFSGVEVLVQMRYDKVKEVLDFVQQHGLDHSFYVAFDKDYDLYVYDEYPDVIDFCEDGDIRIDSVFSTANSHIYIGKARLKWEYDIEYITTLVPVSGLEVQKRITSRDIRVKKC